ncbi:MAG: DUF4417 domain-containing protein [Bacteroidales bacterium]|nr:DUF4417 domain-containing protein [Bacteroidales bacterium]
MSKNNWAIQKNSVFGLDYCRNATFSGRYGIPLLKSYNGAIPDEYITFSDINSVAGYNYCVTGFDYDYVLERLWNNPIKYVNVLAKYQCVAEPDFSLKVNHPLCVQIANKYRSHALSFCLQEHNVAILPCMSWSTPQSYCFCYDGYSKGGVVIVSTIGTRKDERSRMYFRLGFEEMLKRISPDAVVLYGDIDDQIMSLIPNQLYVHTYSHNRFKRARNNGR